MEGLEDEAQALATQGGARALVLVGDVVAVGYEGIAQNTYCNFESYPWMHYVYGFHRIGDGRLRRLACRRGGASAPGMADAAASWPSLAVDKIEPRTPLGR